MSIDEDYLDAKGALVMRNPDSQWSGSNHKAIPDSEAVRPDSQTEMVSAR